MIIPLALIAWALVAAPAAGQPMPADLDRLVQQARLPGPVSAWCRAEFQPGRRAGLPWRCPRRLTGDSMSCVICAFVEDTRAVCWQYSPDAPAFVEVAGWVT